MRTFCTFLLAIGLSACGEESTKPVGTQAKADDDLAHGEMIDEDAFSNPTAPITVADQLLAVRTAVAKGRAMSGARWQQDVEALADLLWVPTEENAAADIGNHMRVLHIAGDAGRAFARDIEEIDRWREQHPIDLKIHDAFMKASEAGPDAYRDWVRTEVPALLTEKIKRLQDAFRK